MSETTTESPCFVGDPIAIELPRTVPFFAFFFSRAAWEKGLAPSVAAPQSGG